MGTTRGVSAVIASSSLLLNDCCADTECRQHARSEASHHGANSGDQSLLAEAGQLVMDHYRTRPHHDADYADGPGHRTGQIECHRFQTRIPWHRRHAGVGLQTECQTDCYEHCESADQQCFLFRTNYFHVFVSFPPSSLLFQTGSTVYFPLEYPDTSKTSLTFRPAAVPGSSSINTTRSIASAISAQRNSCGILWPSSDCANRLSRRVRALSASLA